MPLHALGVDTPLNELKAELFKALAHPVRVRALELLATGPHAVADMLVATGMEASHLSSTCPCCAAPASSPHSAKATP